MESILKYFANLDENQVNQIKRLKPIYQDWNSKINVISRKDFDDFYVRHVLHSLAIAKIIQFKTGTKILDVGTGGGFPGIPLAILFPKTNFFLADSIGKKITVVKAVAEELGLENVYAEQIRAEEIQDKFDFVVSRAVTQVDRFLPWVKNKFLKTSINDLPNGYLFLKGGNLDDEFKNLKKSYKVHEMNTLFQEDFFETKKVIYMQTKRH